MVPNSLGVAVFVGIVLAASVLSYLLGRVTGKRDERRHWERRIAGQARGLDRTRAIIRRALAKDGNQ
jgi:hypothetical protein